MALTPISPALLSPAELRRNDEAKARLREVIARGEALVVVGAGVSAPLHYPDWDSLLSKIEDLAASVDANGHAFTREPSERATRPLDYAESMKRHIDRAGRLSEYHKLLYRSFESQNPGHAPNHELIATLPVRGVLTTNYELCLESAYAQVMKGLPGDATVDLLNDQSVRVSDFLLSRVDPNRPQRVGHLHGVYTRATHIVLTSGDYAGAYGLEILPNGDIAGVEKPWTKHRRLLWAMLATRELVFFGFSMRDPYVRLMLAFACAELWRWREPVNHIVLSLEPSGAQDTKQFAQLLVEKHATETVFYENLDGQHSGLNDILTDLNGARAKSISAEDINARFMGVTERED